MVTVYYDLWAKCTKLWVLKDSRIGCAQVTHLRLTNSRFSVSCVSMNHFDAHLVTWWFHQESKTPKYSGWQLVFLWEKGKMANVILEILDVRVLMYRHSKSAFFASDFEFLIGVNKYSSSSHSNSNFAHQIVSHWRLLRCKLKVCIITHAKEKPSTANRYFSQNW